MVPHQRGATVSQVDWAVEVLGASWLFGEAVLWKNVEAW